MPVWNPLSCRGSNAQYQAVDERIVGQQADHTQLRRGDGVAVLPFLLLMQWQGGNVAQVNPAVEGTATSSRPSPTETAIEPSA